MKASHLKDRSEDESRPRCYQRDPNDLWVLKHQCSLPLHKLPLISHYSLQALGYPMIERGSRELHIFFYLPLSLEKKKRKKRGMLHSHALLDAFLQSPWFGPNGVLIGAASEEENTKKRNVEGCKC